MDKKTFFLIIEGSAIIKRKYIDDYKKGDAIWGADANIIIKEKHSNISDAYNAFEKYTCGYSKIGVRGMSVSEYALVTCTEDDDGIFLDKRNYELAKEELPGFGGDIDVVEAIVLDGEYHDVDSINWAIRKKEHISYDWFGQYGRHGWEDFVEWRDGKTIILDEILMY